MLGGEEEMSREAAIAKVAPWLRATIVAAPWPSQAPSQLPTSIKVDRPTPLIPPQTKPQQKVGLDDKTDRTPKRSSPRAKRLPPDQQSLQPTKNQLKPKREVAESIVFTCYDLLRQSI
jgi:hypothetical protein